MNRPIQGGYAPGSTFKIVSALAALQEGVITPRTRHYCPGYLSVYNTVFRCARESGHGTLDLRQAIAQSCNVYFFKVGMAMEIERLSRYARLFGLGQLTGIDLPHEQPGLFQDPEWKRRTQNARWFPAETVSVSIGQAMSTTPMQMARVAAAVANGGYLVTPRLMKAIGGQALPRPPKRHLGLRPEVLEAVREAMTLTVSRGTGARAQLDGVPVAGKTGSAQVVTRSRLETDKRREYQPHGWFISFAPADNPRLAMAVLVEHVSEGSIAATPVTAQILARYFGTRPAHPAVPPLPKLPPLPPSPPALRAETPSSEPAGAVAQGG